MSSVMTILSLPKYFLSLCVAVTNPTHPQPIINRTTFCPSCINLRSSVFSPLHGLLFIRNTEFEHNPIKVIQIFNLGLSLIEIRTLKPVLFEFPRIPILISILITLHLITTKLLSKFDLGNFLCLINTYKIHSKEDKFVVLSIGL